MELSARRRTMIAIGCGVVAALLSAVYLAQAAQGMQNSWTGENGEGAVEVIVSKRTLAAGEIIGDDDVETKFLPEDLLPQGTLAASEEVVGEQVHLTIPQNQILTDTALNGEARLAIPEGMVAVSVPTKDVQSIGGRVGQGSVVDVYRFADGKAEPIVSEAVILDTSGAGSARGLSWVTLQIREAYTKEILNAAVHSTIYLTLPGEAS